MRLVIALMLVWVLPGLATVQAKAEGVCDGDVPCEIEGGSYHLALPEGWDGTSKLPAIVFFHGHSSSGKSIMRGAVRSVFGKAGYAIIAPNGPMREGANYRFWPARPMDNPPRDDIAFTMRTIEDVSSRIPINRERILVGGFSAGGSMAWMIACYEGRKFAGFVSVAGALRRPLPESGCPGGPARMLQIHGYADAQVPLEGRAIRDWHQGDVFESLSLLRTVNECRSNPHEIEVDGPFWCRDWTSCGSSADIRFCMHPGGHGLPKGWTEQALEWFENPPAQ